MKTIFICLAAIVVVSANNTTSEVDMKGIFDNDDMRKKVVSCILEQDPCEDFKIMKENVPKIIKNGCSDCSPKQKLAFEKMTKKFETQHPDEYKAVMEKIASN